MSSISALHLPFKILGDHALPIWLNFYISVWTMAGTFPVTATVATLLLAAIVYLNIHRLSRSTHG